MSHVTRHMSWITCNMSHVTFFLFFLQMVKLIGGGSVINGAYPVDLVLYFIVIRSRQEVQWSPVCRTFFFVFPIVGFSWVFSVISVFSFICLGFIVMGAIICTLRDFLVSCVIDFFKFQIAGQTLLQNRPKILLSSPCCRAQQSDPYHSLVCAVPLKCLLI